MRPKSRSPAASTRRRTRKLPTSPGPRKTAPRKGTDNEPDHAPRSQGAWRKVVEGRDRAFGRDGPRGGRVRRRRSARDRAVAEALGRAFASAQERAVPIGDVDADLLYQPGRR